MTLTQKREAAKAKAANELRKLGRPELADDLLKGISPFEVLRTIACWCLTDGERERLNGIVSPLLEDALFIVVVNQPGCLPDGESQTVRGVTDARDTLIAELEATAEAHGIDDAILDWAKRRANVRETGASIELSGYVHEVVPLHQNT
jgi:hypothetical protein